MDRYFIEGKNKIINGGVVHKIHYSYEIEFEKKIKELYKYEEVSFLGLII